VFLVFVLFCFVFEIGSLELFACADFKP
jgi:hypothetical protein